MNLRLNRNARPIAIGLLFLVAIVAAQSAAFAAFIAGVETWIEPGFFDAVARSVNLPAAFALFGLLAILYLKLQSRIRLLAVAFLVTGFVFGLEAYELIGAA